MKTSKAPLQQSGPEDVRHVDPEFTKEPVTKSIQDDGNIVSVSVQEADDVFHGFSYAPPQDNVDTISHDSP